jgi:hypothetical protein
MSRDHNKHRIAASSALPTANTAGTAGFGYVERHPGCTIIRHRQEPGYNAAIGPAARTKDAVPRPLRQQLF